MASYIKTLKEDNGDITYPQTLASAVITAGGSDVDSALATKANSADLAAVATSGLYSDLSGTPNLATVATTGSYNDLTNLPSDRLFRMLVPTGTEITSNKNLNTVEFLVVGRYYCSANATVATLSNCPTSSAFMMEVFSPLSTTIDDETTRAWCYRTRILTTFTGEMFVQSCSTNATPNNWSYGSWSKINNVQADWSASSGLAQILNRPAVRHVTAVSDAGWSGSENSLIDGSALAYWNGAYSGTNSNLQYFKNGSVKKATMAAIPSPDPNTVTTNWGSITASGNNEKTMSADGFVVGKACTFAADQSALVQLNGQEVGGISYTTFTGYMQVSYCFPVKNGDKVRFYLNKSGPQHQGCKLIGWKM